MEFRFDMVILFAAIAMMIAAIGDYMPEDFLPWAHERWGKYKEWKARR